MGKPPIRYWSSLCLLVLTLLAGWPAVVGAQTSTPVTRNTAGNAQTTSAYPPASPGPDVRNCGDINFFPPFGAAKEGEVRSFSCTRDLAMLPIYVNAPLTCADTMSTVLVTIGTGKFTGKFLFHNGGWTESHGQLVVQKAGGYGVSSSTGYSIDYVWQMDASEQAIALDTQLKVSNDLYLYTRHHTTTAIPPTGQVLTSDDHSCSLSVTSAKG